MSAKIKCPKCGVDIDFSEVSKQTGAQGGQTTMTRYGRDHFAKLSKLGLAKRWGPKKAVK